MTAWTQDMDFCLKRAGRDDTGALAGLEGILGLPPTQTGEKAVRCFTAASKARGDENERRARRNKQPLEPGKTGNGPYDIAFSRRLQSLRNALTATLRPA